MHRLNKRTLEQESSIEKWNFGGKTLHTPEFIPSIRRTRSINHLSVLNPQSVLVTFPDYKEVISLKAPIHDYLRYKGIVILDPSGYSEIHRLKNTVKQSTTYKYPIFNPFNHELNNSLHELNQEFQKYIHTVKQIKPELAAIPDKPPFSSTVNEQSSCFLYNLKTLSLFAEKNQRSDVFLPIVHFYTHKAGSNLLNQIISGKVPRYSSISDYLSNSRAIAIGGLVPHFLGKSTIRDKANIRALKFVAKVRALFPHLLIHVFGIGGVLSMHLMFALGINTVDSVGWRVRAAYGKISISSLGDRKVDINGGWDAKELSNDTEAVKLLNDCECPSCTTIRNEKLDISYFTKTDKKTNGAFRLRATHNLYTSLQEANQARQMIEEGSYGSYLLQIAKKNQMFRDALRVIHKIISIQKRLSKLQKR